MSNLLNVSANGAATRRKAQQVGRYNVLLRIIKAANDKLDPQKVIGTIMDNIQKLIPCGAWSILLMTKEQDELVFERARGAVAGNFAYARLKVGEGIAGWVAKHRKPVIVNDVSNDPRFSSKFDKAHNFQTQSILCAPLLSRNQVIGVVELINKKSRNGRFTKQDLSNLLTLLGPIAVSLHNALLFQETEKLTITDDLTKLYNNRYINRCLTKMIDQHGKSGKRAKFSVIFLDLDGFKTVNDSYGHLIGGKTLVEIGRVMFNTVRKQDVVARYGGDEFIVMMPHTPAEEAVAMAEQIRLAIQKHDFFPALQRHIRLSASFGISVFPDHAETLTELIQKADHAMYAVKYTGKNAVQLAT